MSLRSASLPSHLPLRCAGESDCRRSSNRNPPCDRYVAGPRHIYRTGGYGSSFGGNPIRQHIGVGDATAVTQIEVTWPTSKTIQRFSNVGMDAAYHIKEDSPELTPVSYKKFELKHGGAEHVH